MSDNQVVNATINIADQGTEFISTITEDGATVSIASSTAQAVIFRAPSGEETTKTAEIKTDGTDGKLRYIRETGVDDPIDETGVWGFKGRVTFTDGLYHANDWEWFEVIK